MKQKLDCIFYIVDNYIYMYSVKYNKLSKEKYSNYIYEGRIIKPKAFIKVINEKLKKEKLTKVLSSLTTIILYDSHLKYIDKKIIIDTFENCNFKNIKLINIKNILTKNKYYIEVNDNYLISYYDGKYEYILYNKYTNLNNLIKMLVKRKNEDTYLIGINKSIPDLSNNSNKIYYLENYDTYLIDYIKKSKQ